MCLAVPARVLEIDDTGARARVDYLGSQMMVGTLLLEAVHPGEYVLVHVGEAIQVIDEENAREGISIWKEWLKQP